MHLLRFEPALFPPIGPVPSHTPGCFSYCLYICMQLPCLCCGKVPHVYTYTHVRSNFRSIVGRDTVRTPLFPHDTSPRPKRVALARNAMATLFWPWSICTCVGAACLCYVSVLHSSQCTCHGLLCDTPSDPSMPMHAALRHHHVHHRALPCSPDLSEPGQS